MYRLKVIQYQFLSKLVVTFNACKFQGLCFLKRCTAVTQLKYSLTKGFQLLKKTLWSFKISFRPYPDTQKVEIFIFFFNSLMTMVFSEPINTVVPRITSGNDIKVVMQQSNVTFTLLCPAQAYPVPVYK